MNKTEKLRVLPLEQTEGVKNFIRQPSALQPMVCRLCDKVAAFGEEGFGPSDKTELGRKLVKVLYCEESLKFGVMAAQNQVKGSEAWELADGSAFAQLWDRNSLNHSENTSCINGDGTYSMNGKRIVAQWHYGPALNINSTTVQGSQS
jgi:hypothetical protein